MNKEETKTENLPIDSKKKATQNNTEKKQSKI